ncbi:MAG: tRNA (adenosine(37)-N6)-dimethylallyltransferase MiaA [Candidatus Sumerlaeia bacterium]
MPVPQALLCLIAGPTATGKTGLAVELAREIDGEVISADSMQIYKGCAIGTAQPTPEECMGIPYHLVGCIDADQQWSVADWLRACQEKISEINGRGKAAIVAGGTGLYFKTLTTGLFEKAGAARNPELRRKLEAQWERGQSEALRKRLEAVDAEAAQRIHRNDAIRTVRALEVYESTGRPLSELQAEDRAKHEAIPAYRYVLSGSRDWLYERIDRRVLQMVEGGFVEELRKLAEKGASKDWPAMKALGYPQMLDFVRGISSLEPAIAETQKLSRRYAKQQMVLYRKWPGAIWLDAENPKQTNLRFIQKNLENMMPVAL